MNMVLGRGGGNMSCIFLPIVCDFGDRQPRVAALPMVRPQTEKSYFAQIIISRAGVMY